MSKHAFVSFTVKSSGQELAFETPEELKEFIDKEAEFWEFLKGQKGTEVIDQVTSRFYAGFNQIQSSIGDVLSATPEEYSAKAETLRNRVVDFYSKPSNCIYSREPRGLFISKLRTMARSKAVAHAVATLVNDKASVDDAFSGVAAAVAFKTGMFSDPVHLEALRRSLNESTSHANAFKTEAAELLSHVKEGYSDERKALHEFVEQRTMQLDHLVGVYKAIQSLKEPASFWATKHKTHRTWALVFGGIAIATAILGGLGLLMESTVVRAAILKLNKPALWEVLPHTFPLTLGVLALFWLLRILIRILMSHLHLSMDAAERVVLANTYLALRESGVDLQESDRTIVFGQLFRHAATGVVKDDAAPQFPQSSN